MTEIAVCLLMLVGTIAPTVLFPRVKRARVNRQMAALWVTLGILGAIIPQIFARCGSEWVRWAAAGLGAILLIAWYMYFQIVFTRTLTPTAARGPEISTKASWQENAAGCSVGLGYAAITVGLAQPQTLDKGELDTAAGIWIGIAAVWLLGNYKRLVDNQDNLGTRRDLDLVFIATYLMYVGQLVSVLAGIGLLHFSQGPYTVTATAGWAVAIVASSNALVLVSWRSRGRRTTWIMCSTALFTVSTAALTIAFRPLGDVVVAVVSGLAAVALFDSIWTSGFRLNERPMSAFRTAIAVLMSGAGACGVYGVYSLLPTAQSTFQRDQLALLVVIGLVGWFSYLVPVSLLVHAPDQEVLTRNGPVFNMLHDSVLIVAALWVGLLSFGWGGYSWTSLWGVGFAVTGILFGLFPMIAAGVSTMKEHVRSPQSASINRRRFDFHTWFQWVYLFLLAMIPWLAIPFGVTN